MNSSYNLVVFIHEVRVDSLKGEIRNRFNLISEERVNIFEQNSENLMKVSRKISSKL